MKKIVVTPTGSIHDAAGFTKDIADKLGVLPEEVILLPGVCHIDVVEVPEAMHHAREKQEKDQAAAEAKAAAEAEKAAAKAEKASKEGK